MRTHTATRWATTALLVVGLLMVDVGAAGATFVATGSGDFTMNQNFNPNIGPDLLNPAIGSEGRVHLVVGANGRTIVTLHVKGLPAGRSFGAHLHRDSCSVTSFGGPHYQAPDPLNPTVGNADPEHEVWLDFTTNRAGNGRALAVVPFEVLPGARSVIIHQGDHTMPGGTAGQRLACLDVTV